jgi:hypothetical protein
MGARDAASAAPKDGRYVVDRPVESPVRVVVVNEGMARVRHEWGRSAHDNEKSGQQQSDLLRCGPSHRLSINATSRWARNETVPEAVESPGKGKSNNRDGVCVENRALFRDAASRAD